MVAKFNEEGKKVKEFKHCNCYVAARIERERAEGEAGYSTRGATVARVLFMRGRGGRDG